MVLLTEKRIEELVQDNQAKDQKIAELETKIAWFEEQFRLAQHRQFGASSEQSPSGQETLVFNEAEAIADATPAEVELEKISYVRRKKKGQRETNLEDLPVRETKYELPEQEQICPQCSGALHEMGTEVTNKIETIPATVVLHKHIRYKYACRHCQVEETTTPIVTASMPAQAFPNSLASPSAVAHIMTQKFVMGLPLYRQEQQFERQDFELSRQTMANWMIKGADWITILYDRMHQILLGRDILHADETTLQVLKEEGRAPQTDSYMWLYRTGRGGPPIVLFDYQTGRSGEYPKTFLDGFDGFLHADCYAAYNTLPAQKVTISGCMAHARRKFDEAVKALPAPARKNAKGLPQIGMQFFGELYKIEQDLKDATPQQRYDGRIERSKPVLDRFKVWLDDLAPKVLPKGALGMAFAYCRNNWVKLTNYLLDGRLEIDNNRAERSIRPFVTGRKNWLFANTPRGANASAVIYSIVETAKENRLDPFKYLAYLFETMPNIDTTDQRAVARLLPWAEDLPQDCRVRTKANPE
jgi:transposase